ncbi:hypothetical protein JCM8547_005990 [Rhodosporidiobolus lusitaniae]
MANYSPRHNNNTLRPPSRNNSNPPSPRISPTSQAPFSFPQSSTAPIPPPIASVSRFNAAFAALPSSSSSRHNTQSSISSVASDSSLRFRAHHPEENESASGDRAFDAFQRELSGSDVGTGGRGLGLMEDTPARGMGPNYPREMGRLYEEPEEYDTPRGGLRNGREEDGPVRSDETLRGGGANGRSGGSRPVSMDVDNSMAFLRSPPPSFEPTSSSAKQFAAAAATDAPKQKDRLARDRTFPAPLRLGSDRSYYLNGGGTGSPGQPASPVFPPVAPLSIPRRPSATAASITSSAASSVASPGSSYQRGWQRNEREGPMAPPDGSTSRLAYHRRQQSSTSSLSHGGSYLPYNNSYSYEPRHQPNASTSTSSTASPSVGSGRNTNAFPTPSTSTVTLPSFPPSSLHGSSSSTPAPSTAATSPEPPISAQALLLHVLSLRSASSPMALSQSQGPLSRSNTPLYSAPSSHARIHSASSSTSADPHSTTTGLSASLAAPLESERARSPSGRPGQNGSTSSGTYPGLLPKLDTVDLSHKRIADVPVEVVEELKNEVEKLALGYNLLKDLPISFTMLGHRLKYLNVRVNMMTSFPAVLCEMPSIEILDISRNKIRKLPHNPGSLLNLKVFSIAKNRIKRLPVWFTQMSHLKVLKLDHNPLEWPPREVATFTSISSISGQPMSKQEEADEMQRWLPALMRWMKENREREVERERERGRDGEKRRRPSLAFEPISEDERDDRKAGGMTRTESGRLNESLVRSTRPTQPVPPIDLSAIAELDKNAQEQDDNILDPSVRHSRNASHTTAQALANPLSRPGLRAKKSLPDLRQSHADILAERREGTTLEEEPPQPVVPDLDGPLRRLKEENHPGLTKSVSARAALPTASSLPPTSSSTPAPPAVSGADIVRAQSARPTATVSPPSAQARQGTDPQPLAQSQRPKLALDGAIKAKRPGEGATAGDFDRNSGAYFRRLSMLPVSTIAKTVPVALLQFADAIRGILFSLSQIYSALRQFVVFASQDRLPAPVARLMGSADASMSSLINALDRFDSLSRRRTPSTDIVRDVFTSCKDNVDVFRKLVGALQPQLKALTATADARYTRTLLLMLYGSMGEIANSWSAVAPLLSSFNDPTSTALVVQPPTPSPQLEKSTSTSPSNANELTLSTNGPGPRLTRQRSTTRRHAGSFSVEDVQMGAVLPPADIPPVPALPFAMEDGGLSTSSSFISTSINELSSSTTLRARPALAAKSSASSAGSSAGGSFSASSSRAPPPGALQMPPQLGYEEMAQKAFEHPLTPGVQGLIDRTTGEAGGRNPSSRAGSFSGAGGALPGLSREQMASLAGNAPPPLPSSSTAFSSSSSSNHVNPSSSSSSPAPYHPPPVSSSAIYRPHRESRPVSTLNADETFIDQAESTMAIASDVYGMLLDSFDDPRVVERFSTISGGRRKLKELGELCKAGIQVTSRLGRAVERVRGEDGRGRLRFLQTDAAELGTAAFEYVQNVIRTAKLMKAVSQELAFPQQMKDAVGQLTLGTREFARLLSHGHTSFRPQQAPSSSSSASSAAPSAGGGHGGGVGGLASVPEGGGGGGRSRAGTVGAGEMPEVRARDFAV